MITALLIASMTLGAVPTDAAKGKPSGPTVIVPVIEATATLTPKQAAKSHAKARKLFTKGKYAKASLAAEAASGSIPDHPRYALMAALALERLGRPCAALRRSLQALTFHGRVVPDRDLKSKRVLNSALKGQSKRCAAGTRYGFVRVVVTPSHASVTIGSTPVGTPRVVAVAQGAHDFQATAEGYQDGGIVVAKVSAGKTRSVILKLAKEAVAAPVDTTTGRFSGAQLATLGTLAPKAGTIPTSPIPAEAGGSDAVAIGLLVSGGLVLVGGGVMYGLAHSKAGELGELQVPASFGSVEEKAAFETDFNDRASELQLFETIGWVGIGLGAALIVGGAIALAVGDEETADLNVGVGVLRGGGTATLSGRF